MLAQPVEIAADLGRLAHVVGRDPQAVADHPVLLIASWILAASLQPQPYLLYTEDAEGVRDPRERA